MKLRSLLTVSALAAALYSFPQANTKLSNLVSPTAINQSLLPSSSNSKDLGSTSLNWRSLYLKGSWWKGSQRFLSNTGIGNTFLGIQAGKSNTFGRYNTIIGDSALFSNTTGSEITAFGYKALYTSTGGGINTAIGYEALYANTTGAFNTALGHQALEYNTSGYENTATGYYALGSNTSGHDNMAYGESALGSNTTGYSNVAIGVEAMGSNTTGIENTATGTGAMQYNRDGSYNTAYGNNALTHTQHSQYNTAVGYNAGTETDNGYNNVFVGANTDVNQPFLYNVIAIGQDVLCGAPSQARIGNAATNSIGGYANWSNISDGRYKRNLRENVPGLAFINKLRPVTYNLDATGLTVFLNKGRAKDAQLTGKAKEVMDKALKEKEALVQTGFVAQEVEKAAKELNYDFSGVDAPKNSDDVYALRYSDFVVPLVKAVQELDSENTALKTQLAELSERLNKLEASQNGTNTLTLSTAYLEQNTPNPVSGATSIRYHIPQSATSATLNFTNAKGQVVKTMTVSSGSGQVNLNTTMLAAGTYNYTLYVDGKPVDTKRLVIIR